VLDVTFCLRSGKNASIIINVEVLSGGKLDLVNTLKKNV